MAESDLAGTRHDAIMEHLMNIKEDVAGIKQHLKNLNGKVVKQEERLQLQECEIDNLKKIVYKCVGGILVLVMILQIPIM